MADPYSTNPLADIMRERDPERYAAVSAVVEPPKLFGNGTSDVPAFTMSGIPPEALLKLPWAMRHAVAANPNLQEVYEAFELWGGVADGEMDCDGLREAKLRIEAWMRDTETRSPAQIAAQQAEDDAWFEGYQRSLDREGLLPAEREAKRTAEWDAKQAAVAKERDDRTTRYEASLRAQGLTP